MAGDLLLRFGLGGGAPGPLEATLVALAGLWWGEVRTDGVRSVFDVGARRGEEEAGVADGG